jgi:uncharacterized protein
MKTRMKKIEALIPLVRPYYPGQDPAHDWAHVGRVAANAKKLAEGSDVDLECVLAAVYCHDIVNLPKDHPDRKNASTFAANEAHPLLVKAGFSEEETKIISQGIIEHSFSKGLKPSNLTAAIVQDADRLDALGAIGVLRCAAVNTQMKAKFYDPFDPLAEDRELDDKSYMLDHYFVKLLKLPDLMNTEKGKIMANERTQTMKDFIDELMEEIR